MVCYMCHYINYMLLYYVIMYYVIMSYLFNYISMRAVSRLLLGKWAGSMGGGAAWASSGCHGTWAHGVSSGQRFRSHP